MISFRVDSRSVVPPYLQIVQQVRQALLLGEPEVFFTAPGYDGWPLVMLRLAAVDVDRLTELVTDAWRMRAPHELLGDLNLGVAEHPAQDLPRGRLRDRLDHFQPP